MNISAQQVKSRSSNLIVGISVTLAKNFTTESKVGNFIQELLFDDLQASGFFLLCPSEHPELATYDLMNMRTSLDKKTRALSLKNGKTQCTVDMLICHQTVKNLNSSIAKIEKDLNLFVSSGYAVSWCQFNINEK